MAGWIKPCPSDLGWLQPSGIIAAQAVPDGGYPAPEGNLLERWSVELIILAATGAGVIWWIVVASRRRSWIITAIVAGFAVIGGLYFTHRGFMLVPSASSPLQRSRSSQPDSSLTEEAASAHNRQYGRIRFGQSAGLAGNGEGCVAFRKQCIRGLWARPAQITVDEEQVCVDGAHHCPC